MLDALAPDVPFTAAGLDVPETPTEDRGSAGDGPPPALADAPWPSVCVVVPTVLRPTLAAAIQSVRAQDYAGHVDVLVVVDRDETTCTQEALAPLSLADQVAFTGGGRRAGHARNMGVEMADTDLVAFLDDDDLWLPEKVRLQVSTMERQPSGARVIMSSRIVERRAGTRGTSRPVPSELIQPGHRVQDYLFLRRRARVDRPTIQTSTLLMSRETAKLALWRTDLPRHQDWDWLLHAQQHLDVRVVHEPAVTVEYCVGSPGSISASPLWSDSLSWARGWKATWSTQTYVDFVCGQPLRYAVQGRSAQGVRACLGEIWRCRRAPRPGPLLYAATAVIPRHVLESLLVGPVASCRSLLRRKV